MAAKDETEANKDKDEKESSAEEKQKESKSEVVFYKSRNFILLKIFLTPS